MINPHFSLNPQNPRIYGAILGFPEDFYCEIHGFRGQSSDLAGDLLQTKSLSDLRIGSFIHLLCLRVSVTFR